MQCSCCGQTVRDDAPYCNLCGEVLRREESIANETTGDYTSLVGASYQSQPDKDPFRMQKLRARRFLLVTFAVQMLPLIVGVAMYYFMEPEQIQKLLPTRFSYMLLAVLAGIYVTVAVAYMIGKAAEATDLPFFPYFLPALFPPLIPGVCARIGNRPIFRPYLYLLIDALVIVGAVMLSYRHPWLPLAVVILLTPFIIYQVFGCALEGIALRLGLYSYLTVIWTCIFPVVLVAYFVSQSIMPSLFFWQWSVDPLAQWIGSLRIDEFKRMTDEVSMFLFKGLIIYALGVWGGWMKSVYENIKYATS